MPLEVDTSNESAMSMIIFGIIMVSVIIISIGMSSDITGNGVTIGSITLAAGLMLFAIRIITITTGIPPQMSLINKLSYTKIILLIITAFILALLCWFIQILSYKQNLMSHIEVINYMKTYLQMFLFTIIAIMFINMTILGTDELNKNSMFNDQGSSLFFVIAETIILFMYLYIIYTIIYNYVTNG